MAMDEEQENKERPRPRVVDKRVSSRVDAPPGAPGGARSPEGDTEHAAPSPAETDPIDTASRTSPPTGATPPSAPSDASHLSSTADEPNPPAGEVWTPQQEEEMRQVAQQIAETPSLEWVVNTAVTLANVAGTKLDLGAVDDARLAVDALAALVNGLGPELGQAEAPLRQTVAQLQMAYAQQVGPPPNAKP